MWSRTIIIEHKTSNSSQKSFHRTVHMKQKKKKIINQGKGQKHDVPQISSKHRTQIIRVQHSFLTAPL